MNKSAEVAARRLSLLWQVHIIVMDRSYSDDERRNSLSELLNSNSLLVATEEEKLELVEEEIEWMRTKATFQR